MFRLTTAAYSQLSPEALTACELFLAALPQRAKNLVQRVELFGAQTKAYEPNVPFEILAIIEEATVELKTAFSLAASMVEWEAGSSVFLVTIEKKQLRDLTPELERLLENVEREGILLWERKER